MAAAGSCSIMLNNHKQMPECREKKLVRHRHSSIRVSPYPGCIVKPVLTRTLDNGLSLVYKNQCCGSGYGIRDPVPF
jgi:hypothetical protein